MLMACAISCLRLYVIEHLADDDAVLGGLTRPAFSSRARRRARSGATIHWFRREDHELPDRKVFKLLYVSRHGHAFIDRALYLPKEWTDDPDRLQAAYVPPDIGFATKPQLATRMIAHAIAVPVPFKWVAGDTVYGVGDIEQQLRRVGKGYVLGVRQRLHVFLFLGQAAIRRRQACGHRPDAALVRLETPVGRGRNQRTAAA